MNEIVNTVHYSETEIDGEKYMVKTTIYADATSIHTSATLYKKWGGSSGFVSIKSHRGTLRLVPPEVQSLESTTKRDEQ